MARDARLALAENLRQFGNGQLAAGAQHARRRSRDGSAAARSAPSSSPIVTPRISTSTAIPKHIKISLYGQYPEGGPSPSIRRIRSSRSWVLDPAQTFACRDCGFFVIIPRLADCPD